MSKTELQALFFDFDGVIVDSTHTKTEGFRSLFRDYGDEVVAQIIDYHRQHGGISRVDKIDYAHRNIIGRSLTKEELTRWAANYSELVVEKVIGADWISGAEQFLVNMHGKVPIFVISGTPMDELKHVIKCRNITQLFQEILGSPVRKPAHIRKLLSKYQLTPGQCVFVGDALTDYDAALETGLHFVGIQSEVDFPFGTKVLKDCTGLQGTISLCFS